jgi:hypothetical protein
VELLHQAVTAGYQEVAHMTNHTELDPLRDREDYKKLIAELEKKTEPEFKPRPKVLSSTPRWPVSRALVRNT